MARFDKHPLFRAFMALQSVMWGSGLRQGYPPEAVSEAVQDTGLAVAEAIKKRRGPPKRTPIRAWILRIFAHKLCDMARVVYRHPTTELLEFHDSITQRTEVSWCDEDRARLYAALDQLPSRERAVFVLIAMEEKSPKEVAKMLKISVDNVYKIFQRTRAVLAKLLGEDGTGALEI